MTGEHSPTNLAVGQQIEILSHLDFGKAVWRRYLVLDWETPRPDAEGRWLFTAATLDGQLGPCPMVVPPDRVKWVR